ncbi:MAG: hypothetical protein HW421_2069 [Ignavibacteria bacterium]|nr:hypothetical protein [Ignavibacteria bacterium]
MLKSHFDAFEKQLISTSKIQENSGHTLHKGTPREVFIRDFLQTHLPDTVAIGTGEIINCDSKPGELRNQHDIIIYKKNYPKLDFGGGINCFLIESVIASIEVKSTLTFGDLEQAISAARKAKALNKNEIKSAAFGYFPPSILNYVVAYNGPTNMETVQSWIQKIYESMEFPQYKLSTEPNERYATPSLSIDGIFILEKGFVYYDNVSYGFNDDDVRKEYPDNQWMVCNCDTGALLLFFIFLIGATSNQQFFWLDTNPYLANFVVEPKFC